MDVKEPYWVVGKSDNLLKFISTSNRSAFCIWHLNLGWTGSMIRRSLIRKAGHCSIWVLYGYWYINFNRRQGIAAFEYFMGIGISTSPGGRALQHLSTLRVLVYQLHPEAGHCSIWVLYGYWYINFNRRQGIAAFEYFKVIGISTSSEGRALQHSSTLWVLVYQLHPEAGHCSIWVC